MSPTLRSRSMLAGLGLAGASALGGCTRDAAPPDADTLSLCYRHVERANLFVQVGGPGMTPEERIAATRQLSDANVRVLHVWAKREGLDISEADFVNETTRATNFLNGIDAEAGLSEQQRMSTLSAAGDAPAEWRERVAAAVECADEISS